MKQSDCKMYFVYKEAQGEINTGELLKSLLKDTIGTLFIDPDKLHSLPVGRTYFSDRLKYESPFNRASSTKLPSVFEAILSGGSSYDPIDVSRRLTAVMKERLYLRLDFLQLFEDDTEKLRDAKIYYLSQFLGSLACNMENKSTIFIEDLHISTALVLEKMFLGICALSEDTYTAVVVKKEGEAVGYPGMTSNTSSEADSLVIPKDKESSLYEHPGHHAHSKDTGKSSAYEEYRQEDRATDSRKVSPLVQQVMINNGPGAQIGMINGNISFTINS